MPSKAGFERHTHIAGSTPKVQVALSRNGRFPVKSASDCCHGVMLVTAISQLGCQLAERQLTS